MQEKTQYDPCRILRKLALNNALANFRLYEACARLQPGEFEAPRTGFFPSIMATLNHILVIDRFYIDALHGGTLGPEAWKDPLPCRTIEELREQQSAMDRKLVSLLTAVTADDLARIVSVHRGKRIQQDRFDDIASHLFQHQTHHRGQVHAMLSGTSVAPPQLDEFIVGDDATVRVAELAALGFSENDLMTGGASVS